MGTYHVADESGVFGQDATNAHGAAMAAESIVRHHDRPVTISADHWPKIDHIEVDSSWSITEIERQIAINDKKHTPPAN